MSAEERSMSDDWSPGSEELNLLDVLTEKERQLKAMREIALALGRTLDLNELLQIVMKNVTEMLEADRSTLYLIDHDTDEMWSKIAQGERLLDIRLKLGEGLAGWVAETGETLNVADAYDDPRFNTEIDQQTGYRTGSVLAVPICNSRGELLGVVQALNKNGNNIFTPSDELLLDAISAQIAVGIENVTLYTELLKNNQDLHRAHDQLARKISELDLLFEVERAMSQAVTIDDLLAAVLGSTMELVGAEAGAVVLADEKTDELYFTTALGGSGEALKKVRLQKGEGVAGWVVAEGKPAVVNEAPEDARHLTNLATSLGFVTRSILCVPLTADGRVLGAIELLNKKAGAAFGDEDLGIMTVLAGQVALVLRAAQEREAREKNTRLASIGQMLSSMVHDFKTPMTAVGGYVELMAITDDEAERREFGEAVFKQIERLQAMTRELLLFARGETEVLLHKVYLDKFVEEVRSLLDREFAESSSELEICCEYQGTAYMDENKMLRVVQNIARNAIQAMEPQGGGTFTFSFDKVGDQLQLRCADTGPGISDAIVDRLFDSFATHGEHHGSGLGLAIVRKIVDEHHGDITFETSPGEGTTFTICIPLQAALHTSGGA